MRAASSAVPVSNESSGKTRWTSPHASASPAVSVLPVKVSSIARWVPRAGARKKVAPPSGESPMFWYARVKRADSAATTRSPASAREIPAPAATPLTAERTGLGTRRRDAMKACSRTVSSRKFPGASAPKDPIRATSPPAENALPLPVRTMQRTPGSSPRAETASSSSVPISRSYAFIRSGRFILIVATPPCSSTITVLIGPPPSRSMSPGTFLIHLRDAGGVCPRPRTGAVGLYFFHASFPDDMPRLRGGSCLRFPPGGKRPGREGVVPLPGPAILQAAGGARSDLFRQMEEDGRRDDRHPAGLPSDRKAPEGDRGVPGGGSRGGVSGLPPVHGPRPLLRPHGDRRSPARGGDGPPRPDGILAMVRRGGSAVQGGVVTDTGTRGGNR